MGRLLYRINIVALMGILVLAGTPIDYAWSQTLALPPGTVLTGPVFKTVFSTCPPNPVPSLTTGDQANNYICVTIPSFVPTAPAAMDVTATPTQFVRVYCPQPTCPTQSFPNRPFMAEPSTIRGMTPAQIQSALALPGLPSMITTVTVPAGSCVLAGWGAPAFGQPGGPEQYWAAGKPTGANCAGLSALPLSDYINQQPIGAHALWYEPFAGGGNAGAVAAALDVGPYAQPFTQMDEVYKSLDLLNFGNDPAPLRAALIQLDGEIYADYSSVAIEAGQQFLGAVHTEMRATKDCEPAIPKRIEASGAVTPGMCSRPQ